MDEWKSIDNDITFKALRTNENAFIPAINGSREDYVKELRLLLNKISRNN